MVEQAEQLESDGPAVPKDEANASSDTNSKGAGTSSLGLHYTLTKKKKKKKPFDLADPNSSTANNSALQPSSDEPKKILKKVGYKQLLLNSHTQSVFCSRSK